MSAIRKHPSSEIEGQRMFGLRQLQDKLEHNDSRTSVSFIQDNLDNKFGLLHIN